MADTQMIDEQEAERRELQSEFNTFLSKAKEIYTSDPVNVGFFYFTSLRQLAKLSSEMSVA